MNRKGLERLQLKLNKRNYRKNRANASHFMISRDGIDCRGARTMQEVTEYIACMEGDGCVYAFRRLEE